MDAAEYTFIQLLDRIYGNQLCCPNPPHWAELSNHICSMPSAHNERYPPSLILGGWWESTEIEKRNRLFEQVLYAYRHGTLREACDYLMSLDDDNWHKMGR